MPGYLYVKNGNQSIVFPEELSQQLINPYGRLHMSLHEGEHFYAGISTHKKCMLAEQRVYEDDRFFCMYLGTIIDFKEIPWVEISRRLELQSYSFFHNINSPYAIIGIDKKEKEAFVVSDRFGQYPIYYSHCDKGILFSTNILAFRDMLDLRELDEDWLRDFMCFHFPVADVTPIKNVRRALFGSVVRIEMRTKSVSLEKYCTPPTPHMEMSDIGSAKKLACQIFQDRFPLYYSNVEQGGFAASITSGFDARLAVSFMPDDLDADLYTYGISGTEDVLRGRETAEALQRKHHAVTFDETSLVRLPELARIAVFLSGGGLNVLRSTLVLAYSKLAELGKSCVVTGVSGDHFFAGHISVPQILSYSVVDLIKNPSAELSLMGFYESLFRDKEGLQGRIEEVKQYLEESFGWHTATSEERHLQFVHHEIAPKYFGGEAAFVENFMEFRVPYWDAAIRDLSYKNPFSTLGFSEFKKKIPKYRTTRCLFAHMLAQHKTLKNLPVARLKPKYYSTENDIVYYLGQIMTRGYAKLWKKLFPQINKTIPLVNWDLWARKYLVKGIFQDFEDMRLSSHLDMQGVQSILTNTPSAPDNTFWLGRLITLELVLEMLETQSTFS